MNDQRKGTKTVPSSRTTVRLALALLLIGLIAPIVSVATAAPAGATAAGCSSGRCTVYLSRSETRTLAYGTVPAPPAFVQGPLRVAYYAFAYGHRWFAQQYASYGWCSGFRLSIYPWESQGYFGYACNWG